VTLGAWGIFAFLWLATLTAARRDPVWVLLLEGAVFLVAAASFLSDVRLRNWKLAAGLALPAALGIGQLVAGGTISPAATALDAVRWLALAAWCVAAQRELSNDRERFLRLAVHSAGIFALLSLTMSWTSGGRLYWLWPTANAEVLGPFINPNHFAVWCELMLAPAIWVAAERRRSWWAAAAIAAGGAASGSRAGLALIALELVVLVAWQRRDLWPSKPKMALAMLAFPAMAALCGGDHLWRKLRDPEPLLYRAQMWQSSLELWRAAPWFGHGLGTFQLAYPETATFDTGEIVDHAHNDWLEWGVEGGLVLLVPLAAGYFYACGLTPFLPWLLGIPVAGLHALVDYPWARFPIALWVVLLITLASLQRPRSKLKQRSVRSPTERLAPPQKRILRPSWNPRLSHESALD
jgi:O-antigen ligase